VTEYLYPTAWSLRPISDGSNRVPPAEYEAAYWAEKACEETKRLKQPSVR